MEKFGIVNIKKILALVIEMGNVADKIGQGKTREWKKYFEIVALIDEVSALVSVKWDQLKPEYLDKSDAETQEIKEFVKEKFDIKDDDLEELIEECFITLVVLEERMKKHIEMARKMKA